MIHRVIRGGSYDSAARFLPVVRFRFRFRPVRRYRYNGFRIIVRRKNK